MLQNWLKSWTHLIEYFLVDFSETFSVSLPLFEMRLRKTISPCLIKREYTRKVWNQLKTLSFNLAYGYWYFAAMLAIKQMLSKALINYNARCSYSDLLHNCSLQDQCLKPYRKVVELVKKACRRFRKSIVMVVIEDMVNRRFACYFHSWIQCFSNL